VNLFARVDHIRHAAGDVKLGAFGRGEVIKAKVETSSLADQPQADSVHAGDASEDLGAGGKKNVLTGFDRGNENGAEPLLRL
jgi:hypothetical protein